MSLEDGANVETENEDVEETSEEETGKSVSESDEDNESAETIKTDKKEKDSDTEDFDETDVKEFEKGYISKEAFLKRLGKSKEKRVAAETRLKEKDYLFQMEQMIESDPALLKLITTSLTDREVAKAFVEFLETGKKETKTKTKEPVDPVKLVEQKISELREEENKKVLMSYNDEFNKITQEMSVPKHKAWLKTLVQIELDNNHQGWRERHIPGLVDKVYKEVQEEQKKIFNSQKIDYIKKKDSDTNPDIGKGAKGSKIERVPIEDDDATAEWIAGHFGKGA